AAARAARSPPAAPRATAAPHASAAPRRALGWPRRALVRECTKLTARRLSALGRVGGPGSACLAAQPHLLGELDGLLGLPVLAAEDPRRVLVHRLHRRPLSLLAL